MASSNSSTPPASFGISERVLCYHGPLIYEAKILRSEHWDETTTKTGEVGPHFFVHYKGWKQTYVVHLTLVPVTRPLLHVVMLTVWLMDLGCLRSVLCTNADRVDAAGTSGYTHDGSSNSRRRMSNCKRRCNKRTPLPSPRRHRQPPGQDRMRRPGTSERDRFTRSHAY